MALYGIVGVGGFGREVMPVARQMLESKRSEPSELVFVDKEGAAPIGGHRVISDAEFAAFGGERFFNVAVASSVVRRRIVTEMIDAGAKPFDIVAGNSILLDGNTIGDGAILSPFTTITSDVKIGSYFHCNIYSYVAHDCVIGDYVTFAPAVKCNGNVVVRDGAYVGTGAIIRQGTPGAPLVIGEGAVIGMGAVVTRSVEAGITVIGNPARPMNTCP